MKMNRRRFILTGAAVGGGVLIGYSATRTSRHRRANDDLVEDNERYITSFIKIEPDNAITIYVPHSEMGQGVHTSLSMMAADELDANWEEVNIEQAPAIDLFANGDLVRGFATEFGVPNFLMGLVGATAFAVAEIGNLQTTGGSSSVRFTGEYGMRTAGAAARQLLMETAAARWDVPLEELTTELSHVHHNASGRSYSYGQLAAQAAVMEPPENPTLKDRSEFNIMGKAISRNDIPAKVNGSAKYGLDTHSEDMLYAAIRLAPVFGSKLVSVDRLPAFSVPGVEEVIELEDSVAVVANSYWRAKKALALITTEWEPSDNDDVSSAEIAARFDQELAESNGSKDFESGDAEAALESAADIIEGNYRVPYLAHAPMEPMNCTVHIQDDRADLWTSTQDALGIKGRVASIAGLNEDNVTFHQTYCGGGFGRRLPFNWNMIDHATLIAKEFDVPVKTIFSREDDMQQDYYRPAVNSNFKAAFDSNDNVLAWHNRFTGPIQVPGAAHIPYSIENQSIRVVDGDTHVPIAAWRSVDHSQQTFFTESFTDEIAHRAGKNPFQFRMEMLQAHPRHRKVLEVAAEAAGYGQNLPEGHALGIAVQESFGSIVAEVAEVSMDTNNKPVVHKVTCAIDCGWAVNPDTAEAQVESGIIFGLSAALYGEITIEKGRVANGNFPDYEMVRMATAPEIDVHIVESGEALGGLGEPSTPPIAAAVTNAIYILTGQRVRELPISKHDFSRSTPVAGV
ncbi:MAG: xanthine dehydrogenase family protein molybdopterin-binding subunit [Gammaproteobacteria bacterium]|jgi:isoquinoline 1-oxidoreductase beta subunit|nr:xanthine dehydrogenase family protein molybdopterin-binding subunit [Gammaproteobacteria bacterium]MDP6731221.1 xanthine dehydrogenase family protein molybdopterin-binding subunit [Gammaproteobacteria bacterium]